MANPLPLNVTTLNQLPATVRVPTYDRRQLPQSIVHIGVGGFHRAHQAAYLDDLLHDPKQERFGICGVGLLPQDNRLGEVLRSQDFLYTLVTRSAGGDHARVIGSLVNFLHAPTDPEGIIERLASPETRIVSLTVTEGGYCENKATGQLDNTHPTILHDLARPGTPVGLYGYLAAALQRRRDTGDPPLTIQSCDNLLNNGAVCKRMLLSFLELLNPDLGEWVAENVAFPNSMVDRITPATSDEHRTLVRDQFGIVDGWPVTAEPFRQWVIEDHFAQGRPAWESVGAQLVPDVEPYEKMKIRLLNGSHQVLCYIGMLLGYRFAPEAMADDQIVELIRRFMDEEAGPLLPPVAGVDIETYKRTLRERFANPAIDDQLGRIGTDGSARIAEFVIPTVREQARQSGPVQVGAFTVAAWIRFLSGKDDLGMDLPYIDRLGEELRDIARRGGADPTPILELKSLFGDALSEMPAFTSEVRAVLRSFYKDGARRTLSRCLERHGYEG
jgi:mannitol 2-dehydrogenase